MTEKKEVDQDDRTRHTAKSTNASSPDASSSKVEQIDESMSPTWLAADSPVVFEKPRRTWKDVNWLAVVESVPVFLWRTLKLTCCLSLVGLALIYPVAKISQIAFEDLLAKGFAGSGVGSMSTVDDAKSHWDVPSVVAFSALEQTYTVLANLVVRWAVMGLAWHGFARARKWPLMITAASSVWYTALFFGTGFWQQYGGMPGFVGSTLFISLTTPVNFMMVVVINKCSSRHMTWRRTLILVAQSTAVEWTMVILLRESLNTFLTTSDPVIRIACRLIPAGIRRVWIHSNCWFSIKFEVSQEDSRFLFMAIPIGSTALVGTCMQMTSSFNQAVLIGLVLMVLEIVDAIILLSGSTQLSLSQHIILRFVLARAGRLKRKSVAPEVPSGDGGRAEAAKRQQAAFEQEARDRRRPLLAPVATQVCVCQKLVHSCWLERC
eukprot:TRINITY_DN31463_c0_g1_i1.p1 TRINITY_DN31463_c0_g1~~TRINITY_DN31463_c0_g1_i1.p1  ORF type:complete len:435 (-),score=36.64 TRINITY_DN31463_c0_g1_i1:437-1741(-)